MCHLLDLIIPLPCDEKPPMGPIPVVLGVLGVVVMDKLMKKLPEYPDGTRDFWSLTLTMLGFAMIMVCPHIYLRSGASACHVTNEEHATDYHFRAYTLIHHDM